MNVAPAATSSPRAADIPAVTAHLANSGLAYQYPLFRGREIALPGVRDQDAALAQLAQHTSGAAPGALLVRDGDALRAFELLARGTGGERAWRHDLYSSLRLGTPVYVPADAGALALVDGDRLTPLISNSR